MKAEFIEQAESGVYRELLIASGDDGDSEVVASVGITAGDALLTQVDIVRSAGLSCFQSVRSNNGLVSIGFGQYMFVVDVKLNRIRRHRLDGYFGYLYDSTDLKNLDSRFLVLATSASEVLAFGQTGDLLWKQSHLGIDGVVIRSVIAGRIDGDGEWDPPGGWQPFTLIDESGDLLR